MALLNVWCYAGLCLQHSMVSMGNFLLTFCCSVITFRNQQAFKTVENDAGSLCSSRLRHIHSFCAAKCKFLTYMLSPQPNLLLWNTLWSLATWLAQLCSIASKQVGPTEQVSLTEEKSCKLIQWFCCWKSICNHE